MITKNRYYFHWALGFVLIVAIGFSQRYWIPMLNGELGFNQFVHFHAMFSVAFVFFYLVQVILVSKKKVRVHRILGYGSVILAIGVLITGVLVSLDLVERNIAAGRPGAKPSLLINLLDMVLFGIIYSLGVINRKLTDKHKRLMTLSVIVLMNAGLFRIGILFYGPGFHAILLSVLWMALLLLLYALLDRKQYGKIHPVVRKFGLVIVLVHTVRIPIALTPFWTSIADWVLALV